MGTFPRVRFPLSPRSSPTRNASRHSCSHSLPTGERWTQFCRFIRDCPIRVHETCLPPAIRQKSVKYVFSWAHSPICSSLHLSPTLKGAALLHWSTFTQGEIDVEVNTDSLR